MTGQLLLIYSVRANMEGKVELGSDKLPGSVITLTKASRETFLAHLP